MFGLLSKLKRNRRQDRLPPELVVAIENIGCVFRSFYQNDTGDRVPRPLCMNFLGSNPFYLDDEQAVARWIGKRYPELSDKGLQRAVRLVQDRVKNLYREARVTQELATGKPRRNAWMSFTEDLH